MRKNAITTISASHYRWYFGNTVWICRNILPQGFPPASLGWKRICDINAPFVFKRGLPGVHETPNIEGQMGVLTFYLVATAWVTARRGDGETGIFDWGALMVPLAVGAGLVTYGLEAANSQTGLKARHCQAAAMFTCYRPNLSVARRSKSWCSVCADSRFSTPRLRRLPQHMA